MKYILLCSLLFLSACSDKHVEIIKLNSSKTFADAGYQIVAYKGYQWTTIGGRWGGAVYYLIKPIEDNGITYVASISKWGNEYHIYNFKAIDAMKPH